MSRSFPTAVLVVALPALAVTACESAPSSATGTTAVRDTLPSGAVRVRYDALPPASAGAPPADDPVKALHAGCFASGPVGIGRRTTAARP